MTGSGGTLAERAGVDNDDRQQRCAEVVAEVESSGLHSVRLAFADPHGVLRGKTIRADLLAGVFRDGLGITSALLMKDTGQLNVYPVWASGGGLGKPWLTGAGDVMMLPDPATFRVLPWVGGTGWLLCDVFSPDGETVGYATRQICRAAEQRLEEKGLRFRAGLEVEFHLYRVVNNGVDGADPNAGNTAAAGPPSNGVQLAHTHPGRVYLGENRFDLIEPFLELLRRDLTALGLPPRSMEVELGPSQAELTFSPAGGTQTADNAVLLRAAVKQIARRNGLHATFMSRPNFANSFTSGWHLHQSVVDEETGANVMVADEPGQILSTPGRHYLAGLLEHAIESCLLTTPTVTGYKRYQPESLAPFRAAWCTQHRGAMLRVVGGNGDPASRIENRVGDSAANPYLYLTSQMLSGLSGLEAKEEPPPSSDSPYEAEAGALLPGNLGEAIEAFDGGQFYRGALGDEFVDYLVGLKRAEWKRFLNTVTDWEQTEYLELF